MSADILKRIEQRRLGRKGLAPQEPLGITGEGNVKPLALPPPPTPEDVENIAELYEESKAYMESAKAKLQTPPLPTTVDWELALYAQFCSWIVNFGLDPNASEDPAEPSKSKQKDAGTEYPKQLQHLIIDAATAIGLEWIPFVDLALAPFSDHEKPASGPFGGVFVSRGANPFMILAFKGTTFPMEVTTDTLAAAVQVRADEDVLYSELAHKGMGQGLFKAFTYVGETQDAFEIIWDCLHAEAHKLQVASGDASTKIPLYVTGHSLGAGYATLAYIELIRRIGLAGPTSFALYDAWVYGSPRVVLNAGAKRVKALLDDPVRHFYRPARNGDLVPTVPVVVGIHTYKHLDIGYKLAPGNNEGNFVTLRPSEIDKLPINDAVPSNDPWKYHWPEMYYEGVKKVLDTQE